MNVVVIQVVGYTVLFNTAQYPKPGIILRVIFLIVLKMARFLQ